MGDGGRNLFKNLLKRLKTRRSLKKLESMMDDTPTGETDADYWFTKELELAAMQGDPFAQTRLATAYHEGLGVEQDPTRAFNFFLAAARQGHSGAQSMVSVSYDVGNVVPQDLVEALFWAMLSKAAGHSLGDAMYHSIMQKVTFEQGKAACQLLVERTDFRPEGETISFMTE
ncbi:sel1 repeat family protein [Ochrobactrum sp. Kaboul]|nr:sel1 repeat family protein [Ochrobactrum sp. Kaboul]